MANVAHAKKSPVSQPSGCACGWGRHCRCGEGASRFYDWWLVGQMRDFLRSGNDVPRRLSAIDKMRATVDAFDRLDEDTVLLRALYDLLPRRKDIALVQRITCDDQRSPQSDEEIAGCSRTPLDRVRLLRALIADAYAGRPVRVPREWRVAAKERRAREAADWRQLKARRDASARRAA
jgi:hypothetical protein